MRDANVLDGLFNDERGLDKPYMHTQQAPRPDDALRGSERSAADVEVHVVHLTCAVEQ